MTNLVPHLVSPSDVIDPTELAAQLAGKASTTHDHDSDYAAADHNHDSDYAAADHNHDSDYMPIWVAAPASAGATGTAGQMAYADGVLYVCVATDTWQKCTIATWS